MPLDSKKLQQMSSSIRVLAADAVQKSNSGHPGMPLGMADVAAVLYSHFLRFDSKDPTWINRDRLILSAGHGCMLLYSILHLTGYQKFTLEQIKNFRQFNSITSGHPEIEHDAGVEVTTGPLGHGVSNAVGMAIAEKHLNSKYKDIINHKVYAIVGDGCLMEGVSYEALALAGHLNLNNLIVIWDNNSITIDGSVDLSSSENQIARFKAIGFEVYEIDGHDYQDIYNGLLKAQSSNKPVLVAAKTKIAWGAGSTKEGKNSSHGSPLGEEAINTLRQNLNWSYPPFVIPEDVKALWQETANRIKDEKVTWQDNFDKSVYKNELTDFFNKKLNSWQINQELTNLANDIISNKPSKASRVSSKDVLDKIDSLIPNLIGGCADLAASVMCKSVSAKNITKDDYSGKYINYGVREHGMGAIVNGLAAYGGFIPYGGGFLIFSDFMRPAIRLAAIQHLQSIFVFSHDSIGVGEDGPTHQPVETLPSLRLIPNLDVLRPCDGIETIEAWNIALSNNNKPTAILLSRHNLPTVREHFDIHSNQVMLGGYVIKPSKTKEFKINLIASGSEVALALEVYEELANSNIDAQIISMPSLNKFKEQGQEYINKVLGKAELNVIIEAAIINGYSDIIKGKTLEFGVNDFGKSAKMQDIYNYFGLTKNNIVNKIKEAIK
ncbi:transketolase [Rickettsiales bacterium LUAb2]